MDRIRITGGDSRNFESVAGPKHDMASIAKTKAFGRDIEVDDLYGNKLILNKGSLIHFLNNRIGEDKEIKPQEVADSIGGVRHLENGKLKDGFFRWSKADDAEVKAVFELYLKRQFLGNAMRKEADEESDPIKLAEQSRLRSHEISELISSLKNNELQGEELPNYKIAIVHKKIGELTTLAEKAIEEAKQSNLDVFIKGQVKKVSDEMLGFAEDVKQLLGELPPAEAQNDPPPYKERPPTPPPSYDNR